MALIKKWFKLAVLLFAVVVGITVARNIFLENVETIDQNKIISPQDAEIVGDAEKIEKSGSFTEIDLVHKGSGQAQVISAESGPLLKLDQFKVTPGPDLFVYLSKNKNIKATKELGEFVSLGKLKSSSGNQLYALPENYQEYHSVVIWCRAFSVLFSVAELI